MEDFTSAELLSPLLRLDVSATALLWANQKRIRKEECAGYNNVWDRDDENVYCARVCNVLS
jgi:hypothetical protein